MINPILFVGQQEIHRNYWSTNATIRERNDKVKKKGKKTVKVKAETSTRRNRKSNFISRPFVFFFFFLFLSALYKTGKG